MRIKVKTVNKAKEVFNKFADMVVEVKDKSLTKEFLKEFNDWLDEYASNDFFGTEGQLDPRGDQRD